MKLNILDIDGKSVSELETSFGFDVQLENSEHLNYLVDKYQKAYLREGTASAKGRGEVSGGGAKPYKQKGTGRARRGTNRSPLRKGGPVIFGPKPRSFKISLNRSVFRKVYQNYFSAHKDNVVILDPNEVELKTKKIASFLKGIGENPKSRFVFILDEEDYELYLSARNISSVVLCGNSFIPIEELYRADKVVFTPNSYKLFEEVHLV